MPTPRPSARASLLVLAVTLLAAGCGGGGKDDAGTTTTTLSPSARTTKATEVAEQAMTLALPRSDVRSYVLDLCTAATTQDHTEIDDDLERLPITSDEDLRSTISALGKGAEVQCPDGVRTSPNLLNDVYAEVAAKVTTGGSSTSSTTSTTSASGGASGTSTSLDLGPSPGQQLTGQ